MLNLIKIYSVSKVLQDSNTLQRINYFYTPFLNAVMACCNTLFLKIIFTLQHAHPAKHITKVAAAQAGTTA